MENGLSTATILDIVVAVILLIGMISGLVRGFFKSMMSLVVFVASLLIAVLVARFLTEPVSGWVTPKAEAKIEAAIDEAKLDLANVDTGALSLVFDESHPDTLSDSEMELLMSNEGIAKVTQTLRKVGMKEEKIRSFWAGAVKKVATGAVSLEDCLRQAAFSLANKAVTVVVRTLLAVLGFLIASILLHLVVNGMKGLMYKITLLKTTDRLLGLAFGLASSMLILMLVIYALDGIGLTAYEEAAEQTHLLALLEKVNLFKLFFKN